MWRSQIGCLEMFLVYFEANVENVGKDLSYRDFLSNVLSVHEEHLRASVDRGLNSLSSSNTKQCERNSATDELSIEEIFCEEMKTEPKEAVPTFSLSDVRTLPWIAADGNKQDHEDEQEKDMKTDSTDLTLIAGHDLDMYVADALSVPLESVGVFDNDDYKSLERQVSAKSPQITDYDLGRNNINSIAPVDHDMKMKKPNQRRPAHSFPCSFCGKEFTRQWSKVRHERMHTGSLALACSVCGKILSCLSSKVRHEKIHGSERPHRCLYCGKGFVVNSARIVHERIHTGERPYGCRYCNKSFTQECQRRIHERVHTGERPFSCRYCNKTFKRQSHRTQHERLHTGERPYVCRLCGRSFICKQKKDMHERSHKKFG